ncbi:hypothetical protein SEA_PAPAYASALAD_35 [Streptomyces phage PapayaSalad]|uniref:Uncharacterized protein n=1 Tax=Streptomyces phage PapayaSalad TaxID=1920310 RepID=A0A1J0MCB3_9CAUD|nr:hypothetical protein HOR44_gp46 [Streptomyces phage PapayaSalad]APD18616.1 hypothetical protein SEA_PAPAYASALAD_35 [Streptomyces phage PapayaSalad]
MQPQGTHPAPRAAEAILGARQARTRTRFVGVVARQLHEIAAGTVRVRTVPVTVNGARRVWVELVGSVGQPVSRSAAECRAAYGLLRRAFPSADWSVPRTYNAATGDLTHDGPGVPVDLGLDTAPAVIR